MSGYLDAALHTGASERGWLFLQKPFELEDLAGQLWLALDRKIPAGQVSVT